MEDCRKFGENGNYKAKSGELFRKSIVSWGINRNIEKIQLFSYIVRVMGPTRLNTLLLYVLRGFEKILKTIEEKNKNKIFNFGKCFE